MVAAANRTFTITFSLPLFPSDETGGDKRILLWETDHSPIDLYHIFRKADLSYIDEVLYHFPNQKLCLKGRVSEIHELKSVRLKNLCLSLGELARAYSRKKVAEFLIGQELYRGLSRELIPKEDWNSLKDSIEAAKSAILKVNEHLSTCKLEVDLHPS